MVGIALGSIRSVGIISTTTEFGRKRNPDPWTESNLLFFVYTSRLSVGITSIEQGLPTGSVLWFGRRQISGSGGGMIPAGYGYEIMNLAIL